MNRFIFIISLLILIQSLFESIKKKDFKKIDIYFILIITRSIAPHIAGWATSKHLVGIFIVSHIYSFLKIRIYGK